MNFNSIEFLIFFLLALLGFACTAGRATARNIFLLVSSYIFYASWDWRYLGLIVGSTIVGYAFCVGMDKAQGKGRFWLLTIAVGVHLGVLVLFKYFNFFAESSNVILKMLGTSSPFSLPAPSPSDRNFLLYPQGNGLYD